MKHKNKFIFVLGAHRSGTSLIANALHAMGINLGRGFIAPNEDNPKGFFEDEEIVHFNDRLLRSMNLSWDSFGFIWDEDFTGRKFEPYHKAAVELVLKRFSDSSVSGLKDPRFCILLPFWKRVISEALDAEVSYVLGIRDPEQCVRSQKARHVKDSDFHMLGRRNVQTLMLWWTYMCKALSEVNPERLVIVDYSSLVDSPEFQLHRLAKLLRIEQLQTDSFCRDQVEPLLNRSANQRKVERRNGALLWDFADTLYQRLLMLSRKDSIDRGDLTGALENLDIGVLQPLYLQELQYMSGYAYRKSLSLRHRLIRTIHELGAEQENRIQLQTEYDLLVIRHQLFVNSRGWRLLTFLRRCVPWPFR